MLPKEKFKEIVDRSATLAFDLQKLFPRPADAIMSLALILATLTKASNIPLDRTLELVKAAYTDLTNSEEDENNSSTNLH